MSTYKNKGDTKLYKLSCNEIYTAHDETFRELRRDVWNSGCFMPRQGDSIIEVMYLVRWLTEIYGQEKRFIYVFYWSRKSYDLVPQDTFESKLIPDIPRFVFWKGANLAV